MNLLITNLLSSLILIPLLIVSHEEIRLNANETMVTQSLTVEDLNSSSFLQIENIQVYLSEEERDEILTTERLEGPMEVEILTTERLEGSIVEDEEEEVMELEILNFKHYVNRTELKIEQDSTLLCYFSNGSTNLVCTASILSILLIAIDQYFAVTHPLRYHTFIDKYKSLLLLITNWLISTLFGLLGSFVQTETNIWNFCRSRSEVRGNESQSIYNYVYAFVYLFVVILMPFVVISVIYGCIYCAAHRNSERMRKSNSGSSNTNLDSYVQIPAEETRLKVKVNSSDHLNEHPKQLPKVKSAPNFANLTLTPVDSLRSNPSFINTLKTKISNASLFRYREETRAAKISILVIFMVLVCYVPYGLTLVINTNLIGVKLATEHFNLISLSLLVLANLLSPFLFAYRNRRIQRELRRLFGLLPKKSTTYSIKQKSVYQLKEMKELSNFLPVTNKVPEVIVTCKIENDKKSILKRVCGKSVNWSSTKKCNFIPVPECLTVECRCSFSSASTQISSEEYSVSNQYELNHTST